MAAELKADVVILKMRKGEVGKIAEVMVRENQADGIKLDLRVLVLGDAGAGKSTLVSCSAALVSRFSM
jgi:GTPase